MALIDKPLHLASDTRALRLYHFTTQASYVDFVTTSAAGLTVTPSVAAQTITLANTAGLSIGGTLSVTGDTALATVTAGVWSGTAILWTKINTTGSSLADLTTRSASDLSSGTLPDGRFPATLPAVSGANLTALNADNIASGTLVVARGGTGLTTYTAAGRLLYSTAATTTAALALGSARQLLQVNAGATAPEWASNIDIPGTLDVTGAAVLDSTLSVTGVVRSGPSTISAGAHIEASSLTGSAAPTPTVVRIRSTTGNAGDWSLSLPWGVLDFWSDDPSSAAGVRGRIGAVMDSAGGGAGSLHFWAGSPTDQVLLAQMVRTGAGVGYVGFPQPVVGSTTNGYLQLLGDAAATANLRLTDAGLLLLNDTSNANMTVGLTLNQGAADDQILACKSSDVATGLTSITTMAVETDDYLTVGKFSATLGGVLLQAMAEDAAVTQVMTMRAYGGTANTTKTTAGVGLFTMYATEHNGANALADVTADGNLLAIRGRSGAADVTRFLFDIEGSAHADVEWTTFDRHHDLSVIEDMETLLAPGQVQRRFGEVVRHDRSFFEREGLLHDVREVGDGKVRGMLNTTRATMLAFGAIREVGGRTQALEHALRDILTLNPGLHGADRALALLEA